MQIQYHIYLIILTLLLINFRFVISKKLQILDKPDNFRKLHKKPIPAIGGLIIFINLFISLFFFAFYEETKIKIISIWVFLLTFFFFLGLIDDRVQLKPLVKTFLVLSILLVLLPLDESLKFNNLVFQDIKFVIALKQSALFFTILSIFLLFNAINFSDGLNGITISQGIFWTLILININGYNVYLISLLICLIIIFFFNISGKLFLGNSGASILSIILSIYFLKNYNESLIKFDEIILVYFLIVIDAIRIIIERIIDNKSPFSGDNNHLHHLLTKFFKKEIIFIPYFFLASLPYLNYKLFEFKTYNIFTISILLYFVLLFFLKKNKK